MAMNGAIVITRALYSCRYREIAEREILARTARVRREKAWRHPAHEAARDERLIAWPMIGV